MKKVLSNLKKAIPPKARIAILTVFLSVGVIAYLIISIISTSNASDQPEDNGLVVVNTKIISEDSNKKNPLISENNEINKQLEKLKETEINEKKSDASDDSYFAGVDLGNKKDLTMMNDKNKEEKAQEDVVDLGALFSNTDKDRKAREENNQKKISDLEKKLEVGQVQNSTPLFDRQKYLDEIKSELSQISTSSANWDNVNQSNAFSFTKYSSSDNGGNADSGDSTLASSKNEGITTSSVEQKRTKYIAKYNQMKSELESRVNGNTEIIAASQEKESQDGTFTATPPSEAEYSSNKTYGAGEIIYAVNDIEIVSDESNVVRATVAQNGDVYHAILLGNFKQIGSVIGVEFTSYTVDGKSYPINAIAIDSESWKSGLADDVDNHYFSRYFGIISAALLEGYAETLTNKTTTNTDNGVSEGTERIESASERLQYSIGKVGEYLAPRMLENLSRESTVTVYRDKGIGIMFMSDFRVPARK